MNVFSRSWSITKLTFGVINKDKELIWFALLSFIFSGIFTAIMVVPSILPDLLNMAESNGQMELQIYQYVILFITYFGIAWIATFFNVCVVYTTRIRFEGGNATFSESIKFAFSRAGLITKWSLLSASVGLLLRLLDNLASRLGKIGEIVVRILIALLGMAWSVITIFVVPVLVYEGLGPIDAIKKSTEVLKRTWGESLVRSIGLGLMQFFAFVVAIGIGIGLTVVLTNAFDVIGLIIGVVVGFGLLLLIGLIFNVANMIFNTALYIYADRQMVAEGFNEEVLDRAFKQK